MQIRHQGMGRPLEVFIYVVLSIAFDYGIIYYVSSPIDVILVIAFVIVEVWGLAKLLSSSSE